MAPKKHNGFMMFVNEWRGNNPEGRRMTVGQAVSRCGGFWEVTILLQKMTAQQRSPYISAAKNADVLSRAQKPRLNSIGQPMTQVEQGEREAADSLKNMKRNTERLVMDAKKSHDLENKKFVFAAFNFFTKALTRDIYVPAEFAACEYSLKQGILSLYSTLINPGHIIFGQGSDAQQHSLTTHNLPLPPNALGETDMAKLYRDIGDYLSKCEEGNIGEDKTLVVFTKSDQIPVVKSCLRYLACDCPDKCPNIEVYDIQYLMFILKKEVLDIAGLPENKFNLFVADAFFLRDFFEFTPEIACQYHEENDRSKYCTVSQVMRWAYTFSDLMCGDLGITVQPGKHIPPKTKPNYRVIPADVTSSSQESSFDSFYSLPRSQVKKENQSRIRSPTSSCQSIASSSNVPTDHTSYAGDLNDFPSLGGKRSNPRRSPATSSVSQRATTMGAWNLPAHSKTLQEFTDDDFSVTDA
ncbi:hypothetical protein KR009_011902 [Drosophila setifemur]|nr:hypothetical protein KR009_011902 [Drosophila setifemur]